MPERADDGDVSDGTRPEHLANINRRRDDFLQQMSQRSSPPCDAPTPGLFFVVSVPIDFTADLRPGSCRPPLPGTSVAKVHVYVSLPIYSIENASEPPWLMGLHHGFQCRISDLDGWLRR